MNDKKAIENLEQFLIANQNTRFLINQIESNEGEQDKIIIQTCTINTLDRAITWNYKLIKNFKYQKHNNSCSFRLRERDCEIYSIPVPTDKWGNTATYQAGLKLKEGYYLIGFELKDTEGLGEQIKQYFFDCLQPKNYFSPFNKLTELGWQKIEADFLNWLLSNYKKYSFVSRTLVLEEDGKRPPQEYDGYFFNWWYWTTDRFFDGEEWQQVFKDFNKSLQFE